jgi:tetratricopeptide (TPR) repeat protein
MLNMNEAAALADPRKEECQVDLVVAYQSVGYAETRLGRLRDAGVKLTAGRDTAEKVAKADPKNVYVKHLRAYSEVYLGDLEVHRGNLSQALARYWNALGIWKPLLSLVRDDVDTPLRIASTENEIGQVLLNQRRFDDAAQAFHEALVNAEPSATANPPNEWALYVVADSTSGLGDTFCDLARTIRQVNKGIKEWREARSCYHRSADAWRQVHNPGAMSPGEFSCGSPKHVSAMLAQCDAALAELRNSSSSEH